MPGPSAARGSQGETPEASLSGLRRIAGGAATVFERLQGKAPPREPADPILAQTRLERWCHVAAGGDWSAFERRLRWEGWEREQVAAVLGSPAELAGDLPEWAMLLGDVTSAARRPRKPGPPASEDPAPDAEPLPFEELLAPFLTVARTRLELGGRGRGAEQLTADALRVLERGLLTRLSRVLARPFLERFSRTRPAGYGMLSRWVGASAAPKREVYDRFVDAELQSGLADALEEYPVAGRLAATLVRHWVSETAELLDRLAEDRSELERLFGIGRSTRVVGIRAELSDPHRGGRTVKILGFEGGTQVVYKPRDVGPELGISELIEWCGRRGSPGPLWAPRVLARNGFGWVEAVAHQPCTDDASVAAYYRRTGILMALAHALRACDCHYENVVAHGDHPVLVDGEVIMSPTPQRPPLFPEATDADRFAAGFFEQSVLSTAIPPNRVGVGVDGNTFELSVLGATEEQLSLIAVPSWRGIGTDRIELVMERLPVPGSVAAPRLGGEIVPVAGHEEQVVEGFRAMYGFLIRHRENLGAVGGPLRSLMEGPVRYVSRPSRVYGALQQRLLQPSHLRSGVEWSIELDALARPLVRATEPPPAWGLLKDERAAMDRLDVPIFTVPASSRDLALETGGSVDSFFAASGAEETLARLGSLDEKDLERQTATIEAALLALKADSGGAALDPGPAMPPVPGPEPTTSDLLAEAEAIGLRMEEELRRMPDGSVTWVGLRLAHGTGRHEVAPLDNGLYGGTAGIALFASALCRVGGSARYEELALDSLRSLRAFLRAAEARSGQDGAAAARDLVERAGGVAGVGLLVYALTGVASLLGREDLFTDAGRAARLITDQAIATDRDLDVLGGAAGAILGLLALHRDSGDPEALDRAVACGRHLLHHRESTEVDGPRAWPTLEGRVLAGFAHGTAGIAYALVRLCVASGEKRFLEAAMEGMAWEDSVFRPEVGNWPDFRNADGDCSASGSTWCHGAPGIGLARLGCLTTAGLDWSSQERDRVHEDAAVAVRTSRTLPGTAVDHVCCGDFGRLETLLVAGLHRGDGELVQDARRRGWRLVLAARRRGGYRFFHGLPPSAYTPGLFQGAAGIGYQLLRLAAPDQVPSLLLLA